MRIVHRFYDLFVGGAEVVVLNTVKALPKHEHILLFSRSTNSWILSELSQLSNVHLKQISREDDGRIGLPDADLYCFHYYPPMSEIDFRDLAPKVLRNSILVNHWYQELPYIEGLRYVFLSEESRKRTGANIPLRSSRILVNPVADVFFRIQRTEVPGSVGRHSRDVAFKFSNEFLLLHEAITPGSLNVFVLGAPKALQEAVTEHSAVLRNNYWMLNMASIRVPSFLQLPQIYLYQTREDFAETCPMNILEAMASGLPIIAENKGGISSLISHGDTGILCNSPQEFIDSAHYLLADSSTRRRLAENAKNWAFENASLQRFGTRFLEIASELVAR